MKITSIRCTPIHIPLEAPYLWSGGVHSGFSTTIVEVNTDEGMVGVGETPSAWASKMVEELIEPRLLGADPLNLAECERRCLPSDQTGANLDDPVLRRVFGGVDMALWDLRGKADQKSIAQLLGGRVRDVVPFSEYFAFRHRSHGRGGEETPTDVAKYCLRMSEDYGAVLFEGKVAALDLPTEIAMVREIRAAIGDDPPLRLDANMGWTVTTARYALCQFERYGIESVEEPVSTLEELARLRASTSVAFSSHEPNLRAAVRLGVPDAFVINLTALGGISKSLKFIHACEALGVEVRFYSPDSGVATAAYLQVASACQWMSQPSQTLLRWHMDDVIHEGPFFPRNGVLSIPDGPGLGIALDPEALQRCYQRFLDNGGIWASAQPSPVRPALISRPPASRSAFDNIARDEADDG